MFEINFVSLEIMLTITTGYIQTDEGGVKVTPSKSSYLYIDFAICK
jgi:hypothetical protein